MMEPSKNMLTSISSVTKQVECGSQPKHSSNGASFIKLLGRDFLKQLHIPREFAKIFNGYIPHRFIIESTMTKECWRVEVEEEVDGAIYFREGWADFVEAHHLEVGNFLLFEYEEQSVFVVKIYDRNGCQKMILDAQGCKSNPVHIMDFDEDEKCDLLEEKKYRTARPRQENSKRLFKRNYGNGVYKNKQAIPSKPVRMVRILSNKAFSVKIHKYMKHQFAQQFVPKAISLAQNLLKKCEVILEDTTGKHWPVRLARVKDGRVILCRGWSAFLKGNEVAGGDSVDFEFVSDNLVKVRVTKASQVEQESEEVNTQKGTTIASNMDCELDVIDANIVTVNPAGTPITRTVRGRETGSIECSSSSFSFLWGPSTPGSFMLVPKVVTQTQNLMNKESVVLRDPDGKCWPVELSSRRDGRVAFTRGWVDFWKGLAIKVGDSLHFEFVSEYVIQVKVNRGKLLKPAAKIEEAIIDFGSVNNDEPSIKAETDMAQDKLVMTWNEPIAALPEAIGFS